jgi:hypothetical protein
MSAVTGMLKLMSAIQGLSLMAAPCMSALSHAKPSSTGTSHVSCGA